MYEPKTLVFSEIWVFWLNSGGLFGRSSVHLAHFLSEIQFWMSVEVSCFLFSCQTVARRSVSHRKLRFSWWPVREDGENVFQDHLRSLRVWPEKGARTFAARHVSRGYHAYGYRIVHTTGNPRVSGGVKRRLARKSTGTVGRKSRKNV